MSVYKVCPLCGANLDPGERCDCEDEKKAVASAANTDNGKAERGFSSHISATMISENYGGFKRE